MTCKNCDARLRTDFLYCPACGAKVIRNRITLKNLWTDILDRYFNLDNTFVNTFVHLFTKPEIVIEGYLQGLRKKYLNPISYLGIALTLSGILVFMMAKSIDFMQFDAFETKTQTVLQEKLMGFILDYQALIFIVYIPLMAISGWLCFNKKGYNFAERTTIFMYTLAHFSLFSFIPSVLVLLFIPEHYIYFSFFGTLTMILYATYTIIRISDSKGMALIARLLSFFMVLGALYLLTSILIPFIMILTGEIRIEEFIPPPPN
ncbi:MAG: DUF3667 domain-containing protein [Flavobacteriaceae bacterium]|nr:DUF3667 domain-containing protein [Flavobacteriaceae bacterium]